ncbi:MULTISPECIES: hypothetical protein [Bacillus]|nr:MULTISPECIES: hypothetical protein [Bacillus]EEL55394.1 hypothetical protein bcere0023_30160 [Bacillus cereus Rock4-2]MEB9833460.1 hypothetical protein [Bacillus cereus]MEB9878480.1 hypothetical protein [Bacillus cereus]PED49410.1 hypothetical protein CON49_12820 [Bacillus cereus]PFO54197.1 hypothetical protein COJ74_22880 [Bacillus cereus]
MVDIVKDNKFIHTGNAVETKMYLEFLFQEKLSFSPILEVCEVTLYDDPDNFIIVMDDATWENARTEGNRGVKQRYSQKQIQQLHAVI